MILYNDAPAPFPTGDDRNDYFPGWNVDGGNPVNATTPPASAPTPGSSCGSTWLRRPAPPDTTLNITRTPT